MGTSAGTGEECSPEHANVGVRGAPKFALLAGLGADAPVWRLQGGLSEPIGGVKDPIGGVREPMGGVSEPIGGSSTSILAEGSIVIGTYVVVSAAAVGATGGEEDLCVSSM